MVFASAIELVGIIMGSSVAAAALGVLFFVVKRLSSPNALFPTQLQALPVAPDEPVPDASEEADSEEPRLLQRLRRDELFDRFYVDLPSLESLAGDLSIAVDPVRVEQSVTATDSAEVGAQLSTSLEIPAVGEVKAAAGGTAKRIDHTTQTQSIERRTTLRELLLSVCEALYERERIVFDPLAYSLECWNNLALIKDLLDVRVDWELPEPRRDKTPAQPIAEDQPPPPEPSHDQRLSDNSELLLDEAIKRTQDFSIAALKELDTDPKKYVLLDAEWLPFTPATQTPTDPIYYELWSNRLENVDGNPFFPGWIRTPSFLVRTRFTTEHITSNGLAQYEMKQRFQATLFAKVLGWDKSKSVLNLTPLVLVS